MTQRAHTENLFYGRGFSFNDIITEGKLGGTEAVRAYLTTRQAMCTRALSQAAVGGHEDLSLLKEGIFGFQEALDLLPKMSSRATPSKVKDALGAYSLLGL